MTSNSEPKRPSSALPTSASARWSLILGTPPPSIAGSAEHENPLARILDGMYGAAQEGAERPARVQERLRLADALLGVLPDEACALAREDALGNDGLATLLAHPERLRPSHLERLEPTAPLIARLLRVADALPEATRDSLRAQVARLVERLSAQVEGPSREAVTRAPGARGSGRRLPGARLDVLRTLRHNLRHYDPASQQLGIERLFFRAAGRGHAPMRVIIALDSSGSMDDARLYGVLVASVLAQLPQVEPRLLLFDTRTMDLSERLQDPVGVLLDVRMGGGTDLGAAVSHAKRLVEEPTRTLLVLISDFEPGGSRERFMSGLQTLSEWGVRLLCLRPPPHSEGAPADTWVADLAALDVPVHDCAPEDLATPIAAVLSGAAGRR